MARTIEQALSEEATRRFFVYRAEEPEPEPPSGCRMTRAEWEQLPPGYRRAIAREMSRLPTEASPPEPATEDQSLRERRQAVEYAARKRL